VNALEVVGVGETLLQLVAPEGQTLENAGCLIASTAGAESNVVCHLARLGHEVGMLTAVGDDPWGRRVLDDLAEAGVHTTHVATSTAGPTGIYAKGRHDGRDRVWYHRAGSAASHLGPHVLAALSPVPRIVHFSGILPALSPTCAALAQELPGLRERGALLSFDVNHRPALWGPEAAAEPLADLARRSDIVFVGLDEAARLWGCRDAADVRAHLPGPAFVIVKDDDRDAVEWSGQARSALAPEPVVVRDVVGAGDAFAAGWLSAYLDDADGRPEDRLRRAHGVAALVLQSMTDHPHDQRALAALRGAPA